ncbi:hypothetical protein E1286_05090 [Nonomuraea terrae]|uniref:Uncharacterized protein n=1 Tax=Nonomuraea terrae TaxID=2530383 RepID=A0A4R4Z8K0_9ACTN|nr:DUF6221 family protein [Nonomuraea terrae]TDD54568.1 hypothetical protein E1286_05090 [Nonomuraea terrae]
MTDDMLSWLREQIEHRVAVARAATQGSWKIGEPLPYSDPGGGISIDGDDDEVAGPGHSGGGVWKQEDAAHITFNDPRQVIADCEAALSLIKLHDDLHDCVTPTSSQVFPAGDKDEIPCPVLQRLAFSYRHRPGYRPEWAPEGATS